MKSIVACSAFVVAAVTALSPTKCVSRRAALGGATLTTLTTVVQHPAQAAVTACKPNANNCWSTASTDKTKMAAWTWPSSTSRSAAIATLKDVLSAYPQAGQADVDLGGFAFVEDSLASSGVAKLEFKSGIGNFAKFFNGGKPFVDDLEVEVGPSSVAVKSSSRVGDSDLGVNAKRLNYIAAALRAKSWDAPPIEG